MIVYRICYKEEVLKILNNNNCQDIGKAFKKNDKSNTHNYKNEKRYIHFFKDFDSIFYLNSFNCCYICTYDIPDYLLEQTVGIGYYLDRLNFRKLESVVEFAIESEQIKFEYLQKIEFITDYIDIEDYIENNYRDKIEEIYTIDPIIINNKTLIKKKYHFN